MNIVKIALFYVFLITLKAIFYESANVYWN